MDTSEEEEERWGEEEDEENKGSSGVGNEKEAEAGNDLVRAG